MLKQEKPFVENDACPRTLKELLIFCPSRIRWPWARVIGGSVVDPTKHNPCVQFHVRFCFVSSNPFDLSEWKKSFLTLLSASLQSYRNKTLPFDCISKTLTDTSCISFIFSSHSMLLLRQQPAAPLFFTLSLPARSIRFLAFDGLACSVTGFIMFYSSYVAASLLRAKPMCCFWSVSLTHPRIFPVPAVRQLLCRSWVLHRWNQVPGPDWKGDAQNEEGVAPRRPGTCWVQKLWKSMNAT